MANYLETLLTEWSASRFALARQGVFFVVALVYDLYRGYGLIESVFAAIGVTIVAYVVSTTLTYGLLKLWARYSAKAS